MSDKDKNPVSGRRALTVPGTVSFVSGQTPVSISSIPTAVQPASSRGMGVPGEPPLFARSPRNVIPFPQTEVEVQIAPPLMNAQTQSLATVILPLAGAGVSILGSLFAVAMMESSGFAILLVSVPMMLISVIGGIYNYKQTNTKNKKDAELRQQTYHTYLAQQKQTLERLTTEMRDASLIPNPDLNECLQRVITRARRLWERAPDHKDFLDIRVGIGRLPSSFKVKSPVLQAAVQQPDDLFKTANDIAMSFQQIDGLAVTLPLCSVGSVGLVGLRQTLSEILRSMLIQISTHHAPNEVKVILVLPEGNLSDWEWARWLPHTWSDDRQARFIAAGITQARQMLTALEVQIKQRKNQPGATTGPNTARVLPVYVFVFADPAVWVGKESGSFTPLLDLILHEGSALGTYAVFLAERLERVPQACGAVLDITSNQGLMKLISPLQREIFFNPDKLDIQRSDQFGRALAPLRLEKGSSSSELPELVTLFDLLGVNRVEDVGIEKLWKESEPFKSLSAPLGIQSGGKVISLDIHERGHGPNGLMAGTVGSGKSELLQTLIISLSAHFHPHEVAFILIDFKALMVQPFVDLPHQIGIITNLDGSLATRALIGLEAEKKRRQDLFIRANVNSIDDYQKNYRLGKAPQPIPHLVIIVDEFAELKTNQPDFINGLVSTARVGRSLGIHLLLATQKPAGVVDETIWANSRYRISLRVERPEDSQEVLKRMDAAAIPAKQRGRAYLQVGMNDLFELLQVAWSGADYDPTSAFSASGQERINLVSLDGKRTSARQVSTSTLQVNSPLLGNRITQLTALVAHIKKTAERAAIQPVKGPWLPPLPEKVALDDVRTPGGWDGTTWQPIKDYLNPVVGLYDDPGNQKQDRLCLNLVEGGHFSIFGSPASGKTTLLQTLLVNLVSSHSPLDLHLYLLDFGGRLLKQFEPLPHVGAVLLPDERERLSRLFHFIELELEERKKFLEQAGVNNITGYRAHYKDTPADILIILDNFPAFSAAYNDYVDNLASIASEGGNLGVHLGITSNLVSAFPIKLSSNISIAVALDLNDAADYTTVVGRTNGLYPSKGIPGRGLVRGTPPLEFQTAQAGKGESDHERSQSIKDLIQSMTSTWLGRTAQRIPPVPKIVSLSSILHQQATWQETCPPRFSVPLGLDLNTPELAPLWVELADGPHFAISGPASTGKSTLLQTWLLSLAELYPPDQVQFYLIGMGSTKLSAFKGIKHTHTYINDSGHLAGTLLDLTKELERRYHVQENQSADQCSFPALVMAVDDIGQFLAHSNDENQTQLQTLMRRKGLGFHVLAAGTSADFSVYNNLAAAAIKEGQIGFVVGSGDYDDLSLLNLKLGQADHGRKLVHGMAYFTRRGRYRLTQLATCHNGTPTFHDWLKQIEYKSINVPIQDNFVDELKS